MGASIPERESLWDSFLERWPIDSLQNLGLSDYCQTGNKDSFTYWLEFSTRELGSISGGSAFKYGIYSRKNLSERIDDAGKIYNDQYAWYSKYGKDVETAFESVKLLVNEIANAARNGELARIDKVDLGDAFKWKIAFLYQNRNNPTILPVYNSHYLRLITDSNRKSVSEMQAQLIAKITDKNVFEYIDELWGPLEKKLKTELSPLEAQSYLDKLQRFRPIKSPTQRIAGYKHDYGHELALALDNKKTTFYFNSGAWIESVKSLLLEIVYYKADKSRSSNLAANAPKLAEGNPIIKAVVPYMDALIAVCDAYENFDNAITTASNTTNSASTISKVRTMQPLNQILYGPPGTGKTFSTIEEALRILDEGFLIENKNQRASLKTRFDELVTAGHIRFVTFHQSFCYEDFVEGLRAETGEDKQLRYEVKDGIFKEICASAAAKVTKQADTNINLTGRKIWKMSLGNTQGEDAYIYDECIENGYVLLGYGELTDFSKCQTRDDVYQQFISAGNNVEKEGYAVTAVCTFLLKMKVGDLLVVSDGNSKFRAIGEITNDYKCVNRDNQGDWYGQSRDVKWLRVYKPSLPANQLMHNQFSQMTLYQLHSSSIDIKALAALLNVVSVSQLISNKPSISNFEDGKAIDNKKVLIIDEINRGNISRIFGELITLIEPSKRDGASEALEITLPYSKMPFSVPANVYIIGTMNTADRSLSGLDIALRRRFTFKEMPPKPELLDTIEVEGINIGAILKIMNERIEVLLDREHCLGHAYFMPLKDENSLEKLSFIFRTQIFPLLKEYFFEDWERIAWILNDQNKPSAQAFVQRSSDDLASLFGNTAEMLQNLDKRWYVNEAAFHSIDSYRGILGISQ